MTPPSTELDKAIETPRTDALTEKLVTELELADTISPEAVVESLKSTFRQLIIANVSLERENQQLRDELAKWKEGCLVNANNARDALRKADEQRLDILSLTKELKVCAEAIEWLVDNTNVCHPSEQNKRVNKAISLPHVKALKDQPK